MPDFLTKEQSAYIYAMFGVRRLGDVDAMAWRLIEDNARDGFSGDQELLDLRKKVRNG